MDDNEKGSNHAPDATRSLREGVIPQSAWQTMAKTVREVDEEKVKDAKEDIDTLLVFAGLFSAVLSAFLVESYQQLQPDTQGEMVFLLRRIASQNYSMSSQFLNATSIPAPHDFTAPLWAVRVNILWFASLTLSLSTASLGMLVQSWLREYLAGEWISPREKLRARQYRHPAMESFKVFEIAAALPLLLQLALGLFFLGLCFFTAAVDERTGNTTLPLVVLWACFFLMTTIAPLVSPRCPFKIRILRHVMSLGRRYPVRFIFAVLRRFRHGAPTRVGKSMEEEEVTQWYMEGEAEIQESPRLFRTNLHGHDHQSSSTPNAYSASSLLFPIARALDTGRKVADGIVTLVKDGMESVDLGQEEKDAVSQPADDVDTLLATDRVMDDDGLLITMREAVEQSKVNPSKRMHFVLGLMRHRGVASVKSLGRQGAAALTPRTYDTLTGFVIQKINDEGLRASSQDSTWMQRAVALLSAEVSYPIPGLVEREESDKLVMKICRDINSRSFQPEVAIKFVLRVYNLRRSSVSGKEGALSKDVRLTLADTAARSLKSQRDWVPRQDLNKLLEELGTFFLEICDINLGGPDLPIFHKDKLNVVCEVIVLKLSEHSPEKLVTFAICGIIHYLGADCPWTPDNSSLEALPDVIYAQLIPIVISSVKQRKTKGVTDNASTDDSEHAVEQWVKTATLLLTSTPPTPPPTTTSDILDDETLMLICESAVDTQLDPAKAMDFVSRIVRAKTTSTSSASDDTPPKPLWLLYSSVIRVSIYTLQYARCQEGDTHAPGWLSDAINYILSDSSHPVPISSLESLAPAAFDALIEYRKANDQIPELAPQRIIHLTLYILRHYQLNTSTVPLDHPSVILDLDRMPKAAYNAAMGLVADTLRSRHSTECLVDSDGDAVKDAAIILLSKSPHPLPPDAYDALCNLMNDTGPGMYLSPAHVLGSRLKPIQPSAVPPAEANIQLKQIARISHKLAPLYMDTTRRDKFDLRSPLVLYNDIIGGVSGMDVKKSLWLTINTLDVISEDSPIYPILEDLWNFLCTVLPHEAGRSPFRDERRGVMESLWIVFRLHRALEKRPEASQILKIYWSTWSESYRTIGLFTALQPNARVPDDPAPSPLADPEENTIVKDSIGLLRQLVPEPRAPDRPPTKNQTVVSRMLDYEEHKIVVETFLLAPPDVRRTMLQNSCSVVTQYVGQEYKDATIYDALDMVRVARLHVQLYQEYLDNVIARERAREFNTEEPKSDSTRAIGPNNHDSKSDDKSDDTGAIGADVWTTLWRGMTKALDKYQKDGPWWNPYQKGSWHDYEGAELTTGEIILDEDTKLAKKTVQLIKDIRSTTDLDNGLALITKLVGDSSVELEALGVALQNFAKLSLEQPVGTGHTSPKNDTRPSSTAQNQLILPSEAQRREAGDEVNGTGTTADGSGRIPPEVRDEERFDIQRGETKDATVSIEEAADESVYLQIGGSLEVEMPGRTTSDDGLTAPRAIGHSLNLEDRGTNSNNSSQSADALSYVDLSEVEAAE